MHQQAEELNSLLEWSYEVMKCLRLSSMFYVDLDAVQLIFYWKVENPSENFGSRQKN